MSVSSLLHFRIFSELPARGESRLSLFFAGCAGHGEQGDHCSDFIFRGACPIGSSSFRSRSASWWADWWRSRSPGASADTAPPPERRRPSLPTRCPRGRSTVSSGHRRSWATTSSPASFTRAPPGCRRGRRRAGGPEQLHRLRHPTGNRVAALSHTVNGQVLSVQKSPDGSRVYIGGDFTTVDGVGPQPHRRVQRSHRRADHDLQPLDQRARSRHRGHQHHRLRRRQLQQRRRPGAQPARRVQRVQRRLLGWAPTADDRKVAPWSCPLTTRR